MLATQVCYHYARSCECSTDLEVARVSSIHHAGQVFKPDSWAVYTQSDSGSRELVYISSMLQVKQAHSMGGCTSHHVQVFRFSFNQLGITKEANRLLINAKHFQSLLDAAPLSVKTEFAATRCTLRGRWVWTPKVFEDWARPGACRAIHLCNTTTTENQLVFTFR